MVKNSSVLKTLSFVILFGCLISCQGISQKDRLELRQLAREIDNLFVQARLEIEELKIKTKDLLDEPDEKSGLYNNDRYKYTKDYVYYTPVDDGQCEIWASGHIPIGINERKRIKLIEHLCPAFQKIYNKNNFIDTIYLTTFDSMVIGYPYADMHAYMTSGLDLTKVWVTYWAAAQKDNPEKKTLWVKPYIDAVGRGYMTSVITPVYKNDFLEGTLGIDITADLISDKFIALSKKNLMIVTGRTIPVAINKNSFSILKIKGLEKYNYLKKEAENKSISTSLMMSKSNDKDILKIASWIKSAENETTFSLYGTPTHFIKEEIPEVGWFLIELKQ